MKNIRHHVSSQYRIDLPDGQWMPHAFLIDVTDLPEEQAKAFHILSRVPASKIHVHRGWNLFWSVTYYLGIILAAIIPIWLGIRIAMW